MILVDFKCHSCKNEWEALVDRDRVDDVSCPSCWSSDVSRVLRPPKVMRNKSDFDLLDKRPPDPPVFSGRYSRSK